MIVVGGLLHQVDRGPHNPINEDAEPVFEAYQHEEPEEPHDPVVPQHPVPGKGLQKFEADKVEGELWIYKGSLHPAGEDGPKGLNGEQDSEEDPEENEGGVVNLCKEPSIQHNYP